tara:strand:- start:1015 stop:1494 length:480 start_codon:yes stop_codon:yes gene_type:complete
MVEVHGGLLFWSVVTFLLLLVVLKKVAWGPIISALEQRENDIKDALNAAEQAKKEAEKVSNDYEQSIKDAQKQSQQIIADSKEAAEKVKAKIENDASKKAEIMLNDAKVQINTEKENAINEIKAIAVDLSIKAASKVVEKNIDNDDNRKLVNDAIAEIS